jgi:A/G-specific adenine glycosylase
MLQQTRAETALRYYRRFLRRFPDVRALARAPETAVLAQWSGLGYYARARRLRRAARIVVNRLGGEIPKDPTLLQTLPGVGGSTAGAIASIAFGVPAPVLDGNVARVLSRLFGIGGSRRRAAVERRLWRVAETLLPERQSGDWNQGLMELGATLCLPRRPRCPACPIRQWCVAFRSRRTEELPASAPRPATVFERRAVVAVIDGGRVLLARSEGPLLAGLYEFPAVPLDESVGAARGLPASLRRLGVELRTPPVPIGVARHSIVNRRIESQIFRAVGHAARRGAKRRSPSGFRWVPLGRLARLPLSGLGLRIAGLLAEGQGQPLRRPDRPEGQGNSGGARRRTIEGVSPED